MPWSVAAAGISAAGSIGGGLLQSSNAGKAGAQAQRNLELILPQMQQNYVSTLGAYQPYSAAGQQGLTATTDLLGLNGQPAADAAMARFQASPGYEYQLQQGLRATDALGAAGRALPGVRSGATIKAEETLGQNLANQDFGNYFTRLNALAGSGLTAAGGVANANVNLIAQEEGNAQAQNQAVTNQANAQNSIIGNTASGLGSTVNNLFSDKNFQNWAGGLFGGGNYGNAAPGTPGISASGNPVMTGFITPPTIGQPYIGGFTPGPASTFS